MELRISIGNRQLMLLLAVIIGVSAVGLVVGYGGSNPQVVGHSWGEIFCDKCINTPNLNDSSVTGAKLADNSVTGSKIGCDSGLCRNSVNGNIGIGTMSPGAKLEVAGTLRAQYEQYNCAWTAVSTCVAGSGASITCPDGKFVAGYYREGCAADGCGDNTRCEREKLYCCGG